MSIKVMSIVFDRYPNGGGEMLLALKLADHAHDDGTHIYPSVDHLANKTRQSVRAVQYQLKRMLEFGWLELTSHREIGRGMHREYRISEAWLNGAEFASLGNQKKGANDDIKGANHDIKGCNSEHPYITNSKPSINRQTKHRATRLSETWVLPKDWGNWALAEYPTWEADQVRHIAAMFKDHWIAASGSSARKHDWLATWRNWCRKEAMSTQTKTPGGLPWWVSDEQVMTEASKLGLTPNPGESMVAFRTRVRTAKEAPDKSTKANVSIEHGAAAQCAQPATSAASPTSPIVAQAATGPANLADAPRRPTDPSMASSQPDASSQPPAPHVVPKLASNAEPNAAPSAARLAALETVRRLTGARTREHGNPPSCSTTPGASTLQPPPPPPANRASTGERR